MNVAIDLDGTLVDWGKDHTIGEWQEGAKECVLRILGAGHNVIVHSCRATWGKGGGTQGLLQWLANEGFAPYVVQMGNDQEGDHDQMWEQLAGYPEHVENDEGHIGVWVGRGKPLATAYVDDNALHHEGDWAMTGARILLRLGELASA